MSQIRKANENDFLIIFGIEKENMQGLVNRLNPEPWSDEKVIHHLRVCMSRQNVWLSEDEVNIAGYYCYSPMSEIDHVLLDSIQVVSHRQSQGIGTMLLKDFLNRGMVEGFSKAVLNVHVGNPAFRLYRRFGFLEKTRSKSHIRMEKRLEISK